MRALLVLIIIVAIIAGVVGYQRGWFTFTTASHDGKSDVNVTVNKEQWRKDRDEYLQEAKDRLKKLEQQLDELKAKAKNSTGSSRDSINQTVDELNKQYQTAKEEVRELGNSAENSGKLPNLKFVRPSTI